MEVGRNPDFAVVIWVPGMNARPCRAALTRLGKGSARALAGAIDAAPLFPRGTFSCPADDGGAAEAMGIRVASVDGEQTNLKITTPADLVVARALARARTEEAK